MESPSININNNNIIITTIDTVYGTVSEKKLSSVDGLENESNLTEYMAYNSSDTPLGVSKHFLRCDDLVKYLAKVAKYNKFYPTHYVNLILPDLKNTYIVNKKFLPDNLRKCVDLAMKLPSAQFKNLNSYNSKKPVETFSGYDEYQLFGHASAFETINIPLKDFITMINDGLPIVYEMRDIHVSLKIEYNDSFFWDEETGKILNYISL